MSKDTISLPASWLFYREPQNSTVFDILAKQKTPPPTFTWEEIGKFYQTKYSYEIVKYEYFMFLRELWEKTWGQALSSLPMLVDCTVDAYRKAEYSLEYTWAQEAALCRKFTYSGNTLYAWVCAQENNVMRYRLCFYIESPDETYELSSNMKLPEELWLPADEDDRYTQDDLWQVGEQGIVDISLLYRAAVKVAEGITSQNTKG